MARMEPEIHDELERRIYETILSFPGRLDEMETRSEDNCRLLARRIADLVRQHGGPGARGAA
ncbi:MAG TPA: hypothetical protein VLL75_13395 [Vicinamibacteria bacterium]|nr:hypothetical protein [Vicinamibacteria bacterium]